MLIAPEKEVCFGFIEDNTVGFYRDLFDGKGVVAAFENNLSPLLTLFHSERMLATVLIRYIRDSCIGKGGDKRREDLLTMAMARGIPNNRQTKRALRKSTKIMTKPTQRLVDEYASIFLIGKKAPFTVEELEAVARSR
jgi:hypothetical protein